MHWINPFPFFSICNYPIFNTVSNVKCSRLITSVRRNWLEGWFNNEQRLSPSRIYDNLKFFFLTLQQHLDLSIRESVPGPVRTIHTVGQTITHHPVVTVIPPLSHHFAHCGFPSKVNLQPLVGIIFARTPGPYPTLTRDCIEARLLGSMIGVIRCWRWQCTVTQMATLHSQGQKATATFKKISTKYFS